MFPLRFRDRIEAGRLLADELTRLRVVQGSAGAVAPALVVALARGGVPVGFAVAERLHLPFDVMVVRKLGVPWQPELAMGAIAGPVRILDDVLVRELGITEREIAAITAREQAEMERRQELCRGSSALSSLHGHLVILVDDGLATGNTMQAAVRYARSLGAARVVVAVPVATEPACARLREEAEVVCLETPRDFRAVGEWYRKFDQVDDGEVRSLLEDSRTVRN